ncbi:MAG TPA: SRPBCC family protein [Cytophagaceae bacterium]|jgi:uncharacterized protein YndB with AHSA1/START domain|nr:SRPBCC family protein [Cytophagaceae bacterium]
MSTTTNSKIIKSTPEKIYRALTEPQALEVWLAPGEMKGKIHKFDLREGGSYEMSLYYPSSEKAAPGKTNAHEDRFKARFVKLVPNQKIEQIILFDSSDPSFSGEMIMEVTLEKVNDGTQVTFVFKNIPAGIKPEDNEKGTEESLEKLAKYLSVS